MARLELVGGAYAARSVIANAQRCINLFPERNRKDGPMTMTHYQRPGLRALVSPPSAGIGRGIWRASNGNGYCCIGQNVYAIGAGFALTLIGTLLTPGTVVVSAADNGTTMVIGDGSGFGYEVVLATNAFSQIIDNTGIFAGTIKWDYLDSFLLWVLPQSIQFGSTYSNEVVFDATYTAGKNGYPDLLQTLYVNNHEILLLGTLKSEIWYDAGNALFPFAILPGAYIEWGILAPRSPAHVNKTVFWLAQGLQGIGLIIAQEGYRTRVVSNYAISYAIGQMKRAGADLSDAVGYSYTIDGHAFYVLTFQSGDQTWVYDDSIADPELAWHQRGWTDPATGALHRERGLTAAWINNLNVTLDWQNGTIYALDPDYYFDYVNGLAGPISYTRTFPQIFLGMGPQGPMYADGKNIVVNNFVADMDQGNGPLDVNGQPPSASLRWSFNRGKKYGNAVLQSNGNPGEYSAQSRWTPLGVGRYPVLELSYSFAGPCALNGGWVDARIAAS